MISVSTTNYTTAVLAAERQAARTSMPSDGKQTVPVELAPAPAGSATAGTAQIGRVVDVLV